ncbi:MAG: PadR family transcriptional regulator [Pseudonocardiales bacterium]|nr:PadR family transcriptional regulator [Pseudonocardiales bacterium]
MNAPRLFVLGQLAREPMHGHEIRRQAQLDRTELWAEVKPGSLYGALHRLVAEGAIEVLRTEQSGGPARTVYVITEMGRQELDAQRDSALRRIELRPDPVDLALQYTDGLTEEELTAMIADRRAMLAARLAAWQHQRERAEPYLQGLEPMTFTHTALRLQAEIDWHDQLLEQLAKLLADIKPGKHLQRSEP